MEQPHRDCRGWQHYFQPSVQPQNPIPKVDCLIGIIFFTAFVGGLTATTPTTPLAAKHSHDAIFFTLDVRGCHRIVRSTKGGINPVQAVPELIEPSLVEHQDQQKIAVIKREHHFRSQCPLGVDSVRETVHTPFR